MQIPIFRGGGCMKLIDVCKPKQWKTISTNELVKDGYPVFGANGIIGYFSDYNHEKPTLCITCRGATCGTVNKSLPYSYVTGNSMALDDLDESVIMIDFLYYFLQYRGFNDVITGSAQPQITRQSLSKIIIPDFDITIQKEITQTIHDLEHLILIRNKQIENLTDLVKSRFNEMFGDPVLNEMGWEKHRLSELTLKIGSGATPRGGRESYVNEGIALIRSMNVYDGKFMFKDLAYLTNIQAEKLNNVIVESDDVLLNITGASVSRCCIVPQNILPARVNQHVSIIRCKKHLLSPIFLNQLLITSEFKSLLLKIGESSGATRQAITKNQIEELYVPFPPLSLQNEFADFVAQVDKSQFACGIVIKLWRNNLKSSII